MVANVRVVTALPGRAAPLPKATTRPSSSVCRNI